MEKKTKKYTRAAVDRYNAKKDRITVIFDAGTAEKIRKATGKAAAEFIRAAALAELERLEDMQAKAAEAEKTTEERAAELTEQARREQEETARREREELENAKPAEITERGELNKARQALKLEKIRKEEEENRAKMTEEQQRAQAFIDQARQKETEAAEEAEEEKRGEMLKPAANNDEK